MERLGAKPVNHMKENVKQMREKQTQIRDNRENEESLKEDKEYKEAYKLSQFRNVESRVYNSMKEECNSANPATVFLMKGSSDNRRAALMEEGRSKRVEVEDTLREAARVSQVSHAEAAGASRKKSEPVPRADEVARLAPRNNADFVAKNR